VRLPEREALHLSGGTGRYGPTAGMRPLPGVGSDQSSLSRHSSRSLAAVGALQSQPPRPTDWFNEERASEDKVLALLSEATELYLKSVLEGAVGAARRRQNLDGVRLWHRQHTTNGDKSSGATSGTASSSSVPGTFGQPSDGAAPLCLRLGCDVRRQAALAEGNAAKTVQRMEEALARSAKDSTSRNLRDDGTLYGAVSMADLARRPKLARAAAKLMSMPSVSLKYLGGREAALRLLEEFPRRHGFWQKTFGHPLIIHVSQCEGEASLRQISDAYERVSSVHIQTDRNRKQVAFLFLKV